MNQYKGYHYGKTNNHETLNKPVGATGKTNDRYKGFKRTTMALGLAGLLFATSACSGNVSETNTPVETLPAAATQATHSTATTAPTPEAPADKTVKLGKVITTTKGKYRQIELPEDSPALRTNTQITDPIVYATFPPSYIAEAKKAITDFIVREVLDSPLNGAGETPEQWWERNADSFSPTAADDVKDKLGKTNPDGSPQSFVSEELWQHAPEWASFSYNYSETTPRIKNLKLEPNRILLDDSGNFAMMMDLSYQMPYTFKDHAGDLDVVGVIDLSMAKDDDGKWRVYGFNRQTKTTQVS